MAVLNKWPTILIITISLSAVFVVKQEWNKLTNENRNLVTEIATLNKTILELKQLAKENKSMQFKASQLPLRSQAEPYESDGNDGRVSASNIEVKSRFSVNSDMNTADINPQNYHESDIDWSFTVENNITDSFLSHTYLTNYTLESVECKKSICDLIISNVDIDASDAALSVMFALKENQNISENTKSFRRYQREENGTMKVSIGRYLNSFETN